eukprot:scaffold46203_cov25-Tisochrysis_lutea.AAC.2
MRSTVIVRAWQTRLAIKPHRAQVRHSSKPSRATVDFLHCTCLCVSHGAPCGACRQRHHWA